MVLDVLEEVAVRVVEARRVVLLLRLVLVLVVVVGLEVVLDSLVVVRSREDEEEVVGPPWSDASSVCWRVELVVGLEPPPPPPPPVVDVLVGEVSSGELLLPPSPSLPLPPPSPPDGSVRARENKRRQASRGRAVI